GGRSPRTATQRPVRCSWTAPRSIRWSRYRGHGLAVAAMPALPRALRDDVEPGRCTAAAARCTDRREHARIPGGPAAQDQPPGRPVHALPRGATATPRRRRTDAAVLAGLRARGTRTGVRT